MNEEEIISVGLIYKNQEVQMRDTTEKQFCDMLSEAEIVEVLDNHEYIPSDYTLVFYTNNDRVEVVFYWFSFRMNYLPTNFDYTIEGSENLLNNHDDRFDVKIGGEIYHFRLKTESMWNDLLSKSAYDNGAQDSQLLKTFQLDGYTGEAPCLSGGSNRYYNLGEVLESSDVVVIAEYKKCIIYDDMTELDLFKTIRIMKGSVEDEFYLFSIPSEKLDGSIMYRLPIDPVFSVNNTYVLCLREGSRDIDANQGVVKWKIYEPLSQYHTAVLFEDKVYPRYNTEHHPFSGISLYDLEEICGLK